MPLVRGRNCSSGGSNQSGVSGTTVVWGSSDSDTVVWGSSDNDTVVWGSSDDGDTVVWGSSCSDSSCQPIVWGQ